MKHDVFISYAREDRKIASRLAKAFARSPRGWSTWWDSKLTTGDRFSREIQEAIADSRCVVVLWSKHSVSSDWVSSEAEAGRQRGILVPVLVDDCEPPMPFNSIHSADLKGWRGSESAVEWTKLLDAVQQAFMHGPEVSDAVREARVLRMQEAAKQQQWRYGAVAGAVAALCVCLWLLRGVHDTRQSADALATVSQQLRQEVSEQGTTIWWWHLFDNRTNLRKLEASFLVAIEAARTADTAAARLALSDAYALLPWSDHGEQIADRYEARTLVVSADGTFAVTAGGLDDTIVWNVDDASVRSRIAHGRPESADWKRGRGWGTTAGAHMADVNSASDLIVTAGPDSTIRVWNPDGSPIRQMQHGDMPVIVAFSPSGKLIAATDIGGEVRLWATATGERLHSWRHQNTLGHVEFSDDESLLASVDDRGDIIVWDTETGAELFVHTDDSSTTGGMTLVPRSREVLTFDYGATVRNVDTGETVRSFADQATIYSAVFDTSNDIVVLGVQEGMEWWNYKSGDRLFARRAGTAFGMQVDTERQILLTRQFGQSEASVWSFSTGKLLRRMPYAQFMHSSAIGSDGHWLATSGADWDISKDVIEFSRIRPRDLLRNACNYSLRNLTASEWDDYLGDQPYSKTCPGIAE